MNIITSPAYIASLTWMVCEMGGKWSYNSFVGCCFENCFQNDKQYPYVDLIKFVFFRDFDKLEVV